MVVSAAPSNANTSGLTPSDALRLVPVEPTEKMLAQGKHAYAMTHEDDALRGAWAVMLAAAPASPLPGGGWQDISTFKGTEENYVLIGGTDGLVCEARLLDDGSGWWSRGNDPTDHWGEELFPTHWMPLPAAPTGDA